MLCYVYVVLLSFLICSRSVSAINIPARSPGILPICNTEAVFFVRVKVSGPCSKDDYRVQRHKEKAVASGTSHECSW